MTRDALLALVAVALVGGCKRQHEAPPKLDAGKRVPVVSTTMFVPHVTANGAPVGARVLLFDDRGEPVRMGNLDVYGKRQGAAACAIANDVIGSYDGIVLGRGTGEIPVGVDSCVPSPAIAYGTYKVWAWRGVEYEIWKGEVDLSAQRGRVELAIPLERAWTPAGTLAADLHVHAHASEDSRVPNPQRVITQIAAGIQVVGLSDHNHNGDLDEEITSLGFDDVIASIASNEISSDTMHLGVYPVPVDKTLPRNGARSDAEVRSTSIDAVFAYAHSFPGTPILQVNHPRFRAVALYDNTAWDGVTWPPPFPTTFDAVEVLAGYTAFNVPNDRRFDDSVRDFFTLTDHGLLVAPLGNSDTHDLNWVLDGTSRTYVTVPRPTLGGQAFDEAGFIAAIRGHRVVATTGPWIAVMVAPTATSPKRVGPGELVRSRRGSVWLDVTLSQAAFVKTERIRITIGGKIGPLLAQQIDVPVNVRTYHWAGAITVGARDTWLAVTADGDTALPLELSGSYQRDRWQRPGVTPYAIAAPILVDGNGDGRWTAPRARKR